MALDVRLFGQLAVICDGHRLETRSRSALMLLAYLVLHGGQALPREKVAGALWPDSSSTVARKNLRQTLWRLRGVIGDACLEVSPESLRLAISSNIYRTSRIWDKFVVLGKCTPLFVTPTGQGLSDESGSVQLAVSF